MAYNILYKRSVARDLKQLPTKDRRKIINQIESTLKNDPLHQPLLKGPFAGLRRLRVGNYRVIYTVSENEIIILRVGHRIEVYR